MGANAYADAKSSANTDAVPQPIRLPRWIAERLHRLVPSRHLCSVCRELQPKMPARSACLSSCTAALASFFFDFGRCGVGLGFRCPTMADRCFLLILQDLSPGIQFT